MAEPTQQPQDAVARRYELLRKQAQQQGSAQQQQTDDALKRRFASMGALNSGEYVKQQQVAGDQLAQRQDQVNAQIGATEAQERMQLEQVEKQREFQSGEAEKQRGFMGGENAMQRAFAADQTKLGQQFQSGETEKAFGRQKSYLDQDVEFKKLAASLAERQFNNEALAQQYNMGLSAWETGNGDQFLKWLQGSIGTKFPSLFGQSQMPKLTPEQVQGDDIDRSLSALPEWMRR